MVSPNDNDYVEHQVVAYPYCTKRLGRGGAGRFGFDSNVSFSATFFLVSSISFIYSLISSIFIQSLYFSWKWRQKSRRQDLTCSLYSCVLSVFEARISSISSSNWWIILTILHFLLVSSLSRLLLRDRTHAKYSWYIFVLQSQRFSPLAWPSFMTWRNFEISALGNEERIDKVASRIFLSNAWWAHFSTPDNDNNTMFLRDRPQNNTNL